MDVSVRSAQPKGWSPTRDSLTCDIIEADQCVESWFKHSIADGQEAFLTIATESVEIKAV
jgi:hypothetical protein